MLNEILNMGDILERHRPAPSKAGKISGMAPPSRSTACGGSAMADITPPGAKTQGGQTARQLVERATVALRAEVFSAMAR